jgi:hypothetical protein
MHDNLHPWDDSVIDRYSTAELLDIYDQIITELRFGLPFNRLKMQETRENILRALRRQGHAPLDLSVGFTLGSMGALQGRSPGFVIGQPVQERFFSLTAPQPKITLQAVAAPQPNISFQTIPAPQPAALPPAPKPPAQIQIFDQSGRLIEIRNETEQEKEDRAFEEWKVKYGAK